MEKKRKRLLFVATRQFWPPSSGKEVTLYYNCKGLHEQYGYDIYLFCFADKKTDKKREIPEFVHAVKYVDIPGVKKSALTILWKSIITGAWPIQNSMFYKKSIVEKLHRFYLQVKPDAVIIDMVRLAPYIDKLPSMDIPHILIEDDLLAKRYRRQLNSDGDGSIAGYLSESMSGRFAKIVNSKYVSRIILKGEIKRLEKYEASLPAKFDYITFISPIETREYNKKYNTNKGITLTMGADVEYCAEGGTTKHIPNSISVVGNFSYGSNAASMEWINTNILPFLPEQVKYYVVGKFPDELKNKINNEKIVSLGYVDDFREVIKSTDVYVAPVLYGTGIKTKIVEAMAMGIPVVTNSIGAEGLDITNGVDIFVVNDKKKMVSVIKKLLLNKDLRDKVGQNGQRFVRENHNWITVYNTFGKMGL